MSGGALRSLGATSIVHEHSATGTRMLVPRNRVARPPIRVTRAYPEWVLNAKHPDLGEWATRYLPDPVRRIYLQISAPTRSV